MRKQSKDLTKYPAFIQYLTSNGALKYIGDPCKKNSAHHGLRFTKSRACVECSFFDQHQVEASVALSWVDASLKDNLAKVSFDDLVGPQTVTDGRRDRSERSKAMREGKEFFHGSSCHKCGCNLRFSLTGECVACTKIESAVLRSINSLIVASEEDRITFTRGDFIPVLTKRMDRAVRLNAASLRLSTYTGLECSACGSRERYTNRGQCVACAAARNRKRKPASARTEAGNQGDDFDYLFS